MDRSEEGSGGKVGYSGFFSVGGDRESDPLHDTGRQGSGESGDGSTGLRVTC